MSADQSVVCHHASRAKEVARYVSIDFLNVLFSSPDRQVTADSVAIDSLKTPVATMVSHTKVPDFYKDIDKCPECRAAFNEELQELISSHFSQFGECSSRSVLAQYVLSGGRSSDSDFLRHIKVCTACKSTIDQLSSLA